MQVLKAVSLSFAKEQIRAGADMICLADHASGGIISPFTYRDLLLPLHQEIFAEIGAPSVLHCCGNNTDRVKYFAQNGADSYHFELQVDLTSAVAEARGHVILMGNINNPVVLLNGSRGDVLQACWTAIDAGVQILSPECAVPLFTPISNLQALVEAAKGARE